MRRSVDPADGRAFLVAPTAKGIRAMHAAREERLTVLRQLLAGADARELTLLGEAAHLIEEMLQGRRQPPPAVRKASR